MSFMSSIVATEWVQIMGNLYRNREGAVHVCDFNCSLKVFHEESMMFCCPVSQKSCKAYRSSKKRRSGAIEDFEEVAGEESKIVKGVF